MRGYAAVGVSVKIGVTDCHDGDQISVMSPPLQGGDMTATQARG
jgi:hypothetical protein